MPKKKRFVVIEMLLPDGWVSMYVGQLVKKMENKIVLKNPCFVRDTGRRHLFFAGTPDSSAEWEPSGPRASFPRQGTVITDWPYDFEPFKVPR